MALRFKMLPNEFLAQLTSRDFLELKAYFQIEYDEHQERTLAAKARAGAKERMRR